MSPTHLHSPQPSTTPVLHELQHWASLTSQAVVTTKGHFDGNDLECGASVTESFGSPNNAAVQGGRLRVTLPDGSLKAAEVGEMAVGTLHNLWHEVETASGCDFRASFITQIYGPNIELRQALINGPGATSVDKKQKCADVLDGLVPMTGCEKKQALGKRNVSPFFEEMGGRDALLAAMALPVNSKSVGKRKAGASGGKGKAARRK